MKTMKLKSMKTTRFQLKYAAAAAVFIVLICQPIWASPGPSLFQQITLTLSVSDADKTADHLIQQAQSLGGYFTAYSDQGVTLRIPSSGHAGFLSFCESQGIVLEKQIETTGFDEILSQKRTSLKAKQDILERYLAVLKDAGKKSIVSVERAVQEVVTDIETLKGSITYMEHELAYARVDIRFRFKDRTAPAYSGRSSFPWLNTFSLQSMIEDFNHEK